MSASNLNVTDCSGSNLFRAGKMPTPQAENSFFVEQASCLFLQNSSRSSIAHQRQSLFQNTEKFNNFDQIYRPKPNFRIELLSSVAFRLNLPSLPHRIESP